MYTPAPVTEPLVMATLTFSPAPAAAGLVEALATGLADDAALPATLAAGLAGAGLCVGAACDGEETGAAVPPQAASSRPRSARTAGALRVIGKPLQGQDPLGILMKDLFLDFVAVTELIPLPQDALIGHARVVASEHDLVLQPPTRVALDRVGEVLGRPAGQLPIDVALVQGNGDRLLNPGPARMGHHDLEVGKIGRQAIDVLRMRVPDDGPHATRQPRAHAGGPDVDHHRRTELVDDLPQRVKLALADREVAHYGMEVEAEHAQLPDGLFGLADGDLALVGVD